MTVPSFVRVAGCLAAVALLSACSAGPKISAQQESTQYRSRAGRNYTPPGPASDPWGPYIAEASGKFDVPERWVREVMRQESGGNLYGRGGNLITSGAGAMGLMQVMPATYDEIRARYTELGDDPYDPHNNILAGTAYIREMYDIYGSPGFLAAYNAGPGRLDDYLTRNRTLPEETRRYVASIGPRISGSEPRTPSPGQQYAMNAVPFSIPDGTRYASSSRYSAPVTGAPVSGPVIKLNPQPAYTPAPVQVATAAAPSRSGSPYIVLRAQPVEVAELPDPRPAVVAAPVVFAQIPEPPRYAPSPEAPRYAAAPEAPRYVPEPARYAAVLPEPPRYAPQPRSQQQMAAASLVPVSPRGFSLIAPANAEPIGVHRSGYTPGGWAIQVGAFANEGLAASATASAKGQARDVLGAARSSVTVVRQPHGMLYRARLLGMSRDTAAQACERLARSRTSCMVVSPDAQS